MLLPSQMVFFSLTNASAKEERLAAQNEGASCLLTLHCAASSATGSPADEKYSHVSFLAASPPMSILCFRNFILLLVLPYRPSTYRTESFCENKLMFPCSVWCGWVGSLCHPDTKSLPITLTESYLPSAFL